MSGKVIDFVVLAFIGTLMFGLSYRTWPDPVVDFGAQLYFAQRVSAGEVLYRDIAYFNGPLSVHFNALLFRAFGASLNVLIVANTLILVAIVAMLYAILERAGSRLSAVLGCTLFLLVHAFSQYTPMGNYNYITPYTQEMTHGFALSLASVLLSLRFMDSGKRRHAVLAGVVIGLTFLTKAEPFLAVLAGAIVPLLLWMSIRGRLQREAIWIVVASVAVVAIAWGVLSVVLGAKSAAAATLGSWAWVFDRRITSLDFYLWVSGFDRPAENFWKIAIWGAALVTCAGLALGAGMLSRWTKGSSLPGAIAAVALGGVLVSMPIAWNEAGRALPVMVILSGIVTLVEVIRSRADGNNRRLSIARLALIGLAAGYLAKVPLNPRISHYGFVLSVGAVMVVVVMSMDVLANWVKARGGSASAVRLVMAAVLGVATWVHVRVSQQFWATKTERVGEGSNWFYGDERGGDVERNLELLQRTVGPSQTLAVVPQGLMINFLVDRRNPIRSPNFMPPEMIAVGERELLIELADKPPDFVLLNLADLDGDVMKLERDRYGGSIIRWLRQEYEVVSPWAANSRFILLRPRGDR